MFMLRHALLATLSLGLTASHPEWESLEKSGRWKVLRYQVDTKARATPNDAEILLWRSKVLQAFGKTEEAYRVAKDAVTLHPKHADLWAQLGMASGDMAGRSGMLKRMSYGMECKDAAMKALELDPKHLEGLQLMAVFYEQAPGIAGGDKAKAAATRASLAALDPDAAQRFRIADATKTKDPARIEVALKEAAQALPRATWPLTRLASRALDPKAPRPQEAQAHARRALEIDPCNATAYGLLGQALAAEGKWPELDGTLARAEKAVPENLNPHYQTARWLVVATREPKRAEALLRRYLTVEP